MGGGASKQKQTNNTNSLNGISTPASRPNMKNKTLLNAQSSNQAQNNKEVYNKLIFEMLIRSGRETE